MIVLFVISDETRFLLSKENRSPEKVMSCKPLSQKENVIQKRVPGFDAVALKREVSVKYCSKQL